MSLRLLVIAGSARQGSFNLQLAQAAAARAASEGAEVRHVDLRALALPVYDADLEAASGVPEGARRLRDALAEAHALLLVTPEYNGFMPPLLLNSFDWLSRVAAEDGRPSGIAAATMKPTALLAASPGALGGVRALAVTRQFLQGNFAMLVQPQQFGLSRADQAFDAQGGLKDAAAAKAVDGVVRALLALAARQAKAAGA